MIDLPHADILQAVCRATPESTPLYLVGGSVRDVILQRPVHDLDIVALTHFPGQAISIARACANALQGAFVQLDAERDIGRAFVTRPTGERLVLDFAAARKGGLQEDLLDRDFTINAIAVDIRHPETPLDPTGGITDCYRKIIRACSPASLSSDSVRVWRAVRLSLALGFRIDPATTQLMRQAAPLLTQISPERRRDELFKLLSERHPAAGLRVLEMIGGLAPVLPEVSALRGVGQSPPHVDDVFEHTLNTLAHLCDLLPLLSGSYDPEAGSSFYMGYAVLKLGRYRENLAQHLAQSLNPDRSLISLLRLAALYHDAGKPAVRSVEPGGRVRFIEHEAFSRDLAGQSGTRLHLSNNEIDRLKRVVSCHMQPHHMAHAGEALSRRAVYRFFRRAQEAGVDAAYLSLADTLATYGPGMPEDTWLRQVDTVRTLLEAWWETPHEAVSPPALLSGNDLMQRFDLPAGREIGRLLEQVREAQAMGEVTDLDGALDFVRRILDR